MWVHMWGVAVGSAYNIEHLLDVTFLPDTVRGKDSSQGKEEKDCSSCIGKTELYRCGRLAATKHFLAVTKNRTHTLKKMSWFLYALAVPLNLVLHCYAPCKPSQGCTQDGPPEG